MNDLPFFSQDNSVDAVVARMADCDDARLKQVMTSVIRHLHEVVKETEPSLDEWMAAIQFLTDTGHKCGDGRQEFILFSDVMGVSMLVDAVNNRKPSGATESTVLGPFHVSDAPQRASAMPSSTKIISVTVRSVPVPGWASRLPSGTFQNRW